MVGNSCPCVICRSRIFQESAADVLCCNGAVGRFSLTPALTRFVIRRRCHAAKFRLVGPADILHEHVVVEAHRHHEIRFKIVRKDGHGSGFHVAME
jgi:hypothetical protein